MNLAAFFVFNVI